jgi:hypothetical protein
MHIDPNLSIIVEKQNPPIRKASFPLRYGRYSQIRTSAYEFLFNMNGEIKFIRGLNAAWRHPAEQLKRTDGNDWVYYSVGDVSGGKGVISWMGEYYLPCLPYPSNSIWEIDYLSDPGIMNGLGAWSQLYADLHGWRKEGLNPQARELVRRILENHDGILHERAQQLNRITGARVSVLPPDTRHVDYEVIPLMIADGCLYHCKFCCIQSADRFQTRTRADIRAQMSGLKAFYGRNLENYGALFLGNHDALAAGEEVLCGSAAEAHAVFGLERHQATPPLLFVFGSVHSLLKSEHRLFEKLNQLPFYTYINIGFESHHEPTLADLGKPLDEAMIGAAFRKMLDVNATYKNIEVTGNFVIGNELSPEHYQSVKTLLGSAFVGRKGTIYLSSLKESPKKRELLPLINEIQAQSHLPAFVYLIQRL